MGQYVFSAPFTADVNVPNVTETVIAGPIAVSNYGAGNRVILKGWVQLLVGTATTGITVRIRKGSDATGALVGEANLEAVEGAAGSTEDHVIETEDRPSGEYTGQQFVLTVQQTAATGAGTAQQGRLEATVGV